jgi:hypothetical protein
LYVKRRFIRAEIVRTLAQLNTYAYSGHSVLMGKKDRPWQDTDYILGYFGKRPARARKAYYSYLEAGIEQGRRKELTGGESEPGAFFCYWAVRELGMSLTELARRLKLTVA